MELKETDEMKEEEGDVGEKIMVGVCVMEKKVKCGMEVLSAPMRQILDTLEAFGEFKVADMRLLDCLLFQWLFPGEGRGLRCFNQEALSVAELKSIQDQSSVSRVTEKEDKDHQAKRKSDDSRRNSSAENEPDDDDDDDKETKYRLNPKYANVKTPERHVRTRLYFTSESHIHSLMNMLRYCNLDESLIGEDSLVCHSALERLYKTKELDYMSYVVLRLFENTEVPLEDPKRFRVEMTFSRGSDLSPLEKNDRDDSEAATLHQEHTLPIMGPERLQELGSYLTLDKMEKMIRPFAMPAEDFPPP